MKLPRHPTAHCGCRSCKAVKIFTPTTTAVVAFSVAESVQQYCTATKRSIMYHLAARSVLPFRSSIDHHTSQRTEEFKSANSYSRRDTHKPSSPQKVTFLLPQATLT